MYHEVCIFPAHTGFGMYGTGELSDPWESESDLLSEMVSTTREFYELGSDVPLPDGVEDIRGRIHNEPDRIFALKYPGSDWKYVGIVETTENT